MVKNYFTLEYSCATVFRETFSNSERLCSILLQGAYVDEFFVQYLNSELRSL